MAAYNSSEHVYLDDVSWLKNKTYHRDLRIATYIRSPKAKPNGIIVASRRSLSSQGTCLSAISSLDYELYLSVSSYDMFLMRYLLVFRDLIEFKHIMHTIF